MPGVRSAAAVMILLLGGCAGGAPADGPAAAASHGRAPLRSAAASPPRSPAGPSSAGGDVLPVTFAASDLTLAGDLRIPGGRGPHPGVVLIHGSGPSSRDGVLPGQLAMVFPQPVSLLADLAEALRDGGYAVLTYDKRTCGVFNGCADNAYPEPGGDLTVESFVADANAAVRFLRTRPEVLDRSIAVAGHSQGATFVPGMLLDDPTLAAGVLLSAPYDPVDELLAGQAETAARIVAQLDSPSAGATDAIAQLQELARSVAGLRRGGGADITMLGGAPVGFWRSWLRLSDGVPQLAAQASQPQLVLNGGADTNVTPAQTAKWRATLTGDRDRVVELACVSHALNCLGTDEPAAVVADAIDATVDPRVARAVITFLDDVMR